MQGELRADYPYDVLHQEPDVVVRTTYAQLVDDRTITFYLPDAGDVNLLQYVIIEVKHDSVDLTQAQVLNKDDLVITRSFTEDADGTKVNLKLTPGADLRGVRVPLEIPKCLANSISEIAFDQDNFVVVNDDPLMVWTFDTLTTEQDISFSIPKTVDESCKDQLRAFGLAGEKRSPINPWLPLAIIPIIGLVLVFFQRFHEAGAEQHLSKKEFHKLAKEQGHEDHEIERAWRDYQRRS